MTVKISRLIDGSAENDFSQRILKDIIVSPFFRNLPDRKFSFCFLFEGFFIEIFVPGHTLKHRTTKGVVDPLKNIIVAPYVNVFDIPELVQLLVAGYMKNLDGKVNFAT
jgi:hypothetical protein